MVSVRPHANKGENIMAVNKNLEKLFGGMVSKNIQKAVGYMRVSTPGQATMDEKKEHGDSALQSESLNAYFHPKEVPNDGLPRYNVFKEAGLKNFASTSGEFLFDIASGTSGYLRPGFKKLCELLANGQVNVVVVPFVDRLARDSETSQELVSLLTKAKAKVIEIGNMTRRPDIYDFDPTNSADYEVNCIRFTIQATGAAIFSKERSASSRQASIRAMNAGIYHTGAAARYGYEWVYDTKERKRATFCPGRFVIVPKEAEIVKEIFNLYAWGEAVKPVDADLNSEWRGMGATQIAAAIWKSDGVRFSNDFIYRILKSRAYDEGIYVFRTVNGVWQSKFVRAFVAKMGLRGKVGGKLTKEDKIYIMRKVDEENGTSFSEGLDDVRHGVYPIIVDDAETSARVKARLSDENKPHEKPRNYFNGSKGWLSGLLYCPHCGQPYYRAHKPQPPTRISKFGNDKKAGKMVGGQRGFYVSGAVHKRIDCPNQTNISYLMDDWVFDFVSGIVLNDETYKKAFENFITNASIAERRARIKESDKKSLVKAIQDNIQKLNASIENCDNRIETALFRGDVKRVADLKAEKSKAMTDLGTEKRRLIAEKKRGTSGEEIQIEELKDLKKKVRDLLKKGKPEDIPEELKAKFVRSFVERIDYWHPRVQIGPGKYSKEYQSEITPDGMDTGLTEASVSFTMRWIGEVPQQYSALINLRRNEILNQYTTGDIVDENGDETDEPDTFPPLPKKGKKGGGNRGSGGNSYRNTDGNSSDGTGGISGPGFSKGSAASPIPGTFLMSSSRLNKAVEVR